MLRLKHLVVVLFGLLTIPGTPVRAQQIASDTAPLPLRVGIFVNLFLDSGFASNTYRHGNQMPRYFLPGLDFTDGALLALDTIATNGRPLRVQVFDLRSTQQSITVLEAKQVFDSLDLLIGAVSGVEYRQLADIAFSRRIPFVSATFPNDGGVMNNPYTIILNATLPVHSKAIAQYVRTAHKGSNVIYIRKRGQQEDRLAGYFNELRAANGSKPAWKTLHVQDTVNALQLETLLDSSRTNLIIVGSLDERFGQQALRTIAALKTYRMAVVGMPTWEAMLQTNTNDWKEVEIVYTTTFYNRGDALSESFAGRFTEKTGGRPSDLAYKGFETTWYFVNLLLQYGTAFQNYLKQPQWYLFTRYNIEPVINPATGRTDYYENKNIYLFMRQGGTTRFVDRY